MGADPQICEHKLEMIYFCNFYFIWTYAQTFKRKLDL